MQNSFTLKDPKIALGKPSKNQNSKSELFKLARTSPPSSKFEPEFLSKKCQTDFDIFKHFKYKL